MKIQALEVSLLEGSLEVDGFTILSVNPVAMMFGFEAEYGLEKTLKKYLTDHGYTHFSITTAEVWKWDKESYKSVTLQFSSRKGFKYAK